MGDDTRPCPHCGEEIKAVAKKCRHCGEFFDPALRAEARGHDASLADLHQIAWYQRGVILCILLYLLGVVASVAVPQARGPISLLILPVILGGTVCVFLLAIRIYSPVAGVLLGLLTLVPCLGLLVLLQINAKATSLLSEQGIRVGLLGADMSGVPPA